MTEQDRLPGDQAAFRAALPDIKAARAAHPERYPADFDAVIGMLEDTLVEVDRLRGLLEGTRESVREWRHTADEAAKQAQQIVGLEAAARSAFAEVDRLRGLLKKHGISPDPQ